MEEKEVKKAFRDAEQEHEATKIETLKKVITATLEKREALKKKRAAYLAKIDKQLDTLKRDIDDFKSGRLDRISERQEKDKEAEETSVVRIEKMIEVERYYARPWYEPYRFVWNVVPTDNTVTYTSTSDTLFKAVGGDPSIATGTVYASANSGVYNLGFDGLNTSQEIVMTGRIASVHASGAYELGDGSIKNI